MENPHDIEFGDEFLHMISKTRARTRKKNKSHCHQNLKYLFIKHQKQLEKITQRTGENIFKAHV